MLEDLHGCGELGGRAFVQDQQAVAESHCLDLIVGNVKAGDAEATLQAADFGAHLDAEFGVQIGQRLIEQEQFRIPHNRSAHRNALALAAGQLARFSSQ